jgi:hypothetical protein
MIDDGWIGGFGSKFTHAAAEFKICGFNTPWR